MLKRTHGPEQGLFEVSKKIPSVTEDELKLKQKCLYL